MEEPNITTNNYESMVEDCNSLFEGIFISRQAKIETYYAIGERIKQEQPEGEVKELVHGVARATGRAVRTLYYAVKFYQYVVDNHETLEDFLNSVDEGKNISWNKIKKNYLELSTDEGIKENKKYTLNQALNMMQEKCDHDENEGGRQLIEWFKEECLNK